MKEIIVKVFPDSKVDQVEESEKGLRVFVTCPPKAGSANLATRQLLSKHFSVLLKNVIIVSGHKSQNKRIRIFD